MRFVKMILALSICAVVAVASVACGGGESTKSAVEYGLVHSHYVGIATVTVKGDKITKVNIDELSTPYDWGRIDRIVESATTIEADEKVTNSEYTGTGTNREYAKYIIIDDVVFTARANGASNTYVDYFNEAKNNTTTFENWLKDSANAKWYYDAMMAGDFDVVSEDGTPYEVEFTVSAAGELSKTERWLKSKNGYWPATSGSGIGWEANMEAIADYIVANGFEDYKAARDTLIIDGEIIINDVSTGATVVDFKDYMDLAIKAHEKALAA